MYLITLLHIIGGHNLCLIFYFYTSLVEVYFFVYMSSDQQLTQLFQSRKETLNITKVSAPESLEKIKSRMFYSILKQLKTGTQPLKLLIDQEITKYCLHRL